MCLCKCPVDDGNCDNDSTYNDDDDNAAADDANNNYGNNRNSIAHILMMMITTQALKCENRIVHTLLPSP